VSAALLDAQETTLRRARRVQTLCDRATERSEELFARYQTLRRAACLRNDSHLWQRADALLDRAQRHATRARKLWTASLDLLIKGRVL
jgi:hypothetical protein